MPAEDSNKTYIHILQRELIPAQGCTEPISIAYAAAVARKTLGAPPQRLHARCSGNIIKNAKGVLVPGGGGMKGIEAAACLGAFGGNADAGLQVLAGLSDESLALARKAVQDDICRVSHLDSGELLHLVVEAEGETGSALVEIKGTHSNVVRIAKNGEVVYSQSADAAYSDDEDLSLSVAGILRFARCVDIEDVRALLDEQIRCNTAISDAGLHGEYGVAVGRICLQEAGNSVVGRASARAAAGSDARMGGCELPVVINSGSGNQGITVSLPVIEYAEHLGASKEQLYRALVVSNLVSIHIKSGIGRLSAFCGAVSAACGSGAGIAFLHDESDTVIENTIINTLGNLSGMICDGAKPSCAAKVASAVDAAILGYRMAAGGKVFAPGEGIVGKTVEDTIEGVVKIGRWGMRETDTVIMDIMVS